MKTQITHPNGAHNSHRSHRAHASHSPAPKHHAARSLLHAPRSLFTPTLKEMLASALRADFEERNLRIVHDDKLRADLRALKKLITTSGNSRFDGSCDDSHCDRFWALALRQHAARYQPSIGALVG